MSLITHFFTFRLVLLSEETAMKKDEYWPGLNCLTKTKAFRVVLNTRIATLKKQQHQFWRGPKTTIQSKVPNFIMKTVSYTTKAKYQKENHKHTHRIIISLSVTHAHTHTLPLYNLRLLITFTSYSPLWWCKNINPLIVYFCSKHHGHVNKVVRLESCIFTGSSIQVKRSAFFLSFCLFYIYIFFTASMQSASRRGKTHNPWLLLCK